MQMPVKAEIGSLLQRFERAGRAGHAIFSGGFAHPGEVTVAFFNGHVEVDAGEFFAKSADVKVPLDLADTSEFFF